MWEQTQWIRLSDEELKRKAALPGDLGGRFAYFRLNADLPDHAQLTVHLTAVSRYRLWVNGTPVLSGPCKGDMTRQYYETADLTPYLFPGKNTLAVQVLFNDPDTARDQTDTRAAIYGAVGSGNAHALALQGTVLDASGNPVCSVSTGQAPWKAWLDHTFFLHSTDMTVYLGACEETIDFRLTPPAWRCVSFDDSDWLPARKAAPVAFSDIFQSVGLVPRLPVIPREIPLMEETESAFARIIPRENDLVLDAGAHHNGYPRFCFTGNSGTEISITYLERFGDGTGMQRIDDMTRSFSGREDRIILNGQEICYEPFWVRTFRFIVIRLNGASLSGTPVFRKTGYPLAVDAQVSSSVPWVGQLWEISLRTLRNCMLETYMDCPYYEQLQFIMDTRLQMLFNYAVSHDFRLARKALRDFHCGMLPNGLLPGKTPSAYCQVISTFSLHYAFALWEYTQASGDLEPARLYRPDIDRILDYYDLHRDESGLVGRIGYWPFVDWQDMWKDSAGVPPAYFEGPSTIINLMYAWALECGARVCEITGRQGTAEEYRNRRETILQAVRTLCFDSEAGMLREGPQYPEFSRHAQAWAVINGMLTPVESRTALIHALACPPCSFSASYEWFRALERAGMEDEMRSSLDAWIALLRRGSTTCPEEPNHPRSECHAWSALPLYEFIRTMAGVHQDGNIIFIRPRLFDLPDLSGTAVTLLGNVQFEYIRDTDGALHCKISLPPTAEGRLIPPSGKQLSFVQTLECTL